MTVASIVLAVVAFGVAIAMLVVANKQRDRSSVAVAARLGALRWALVGIGLLAGLYWIGFLIIAVVLWVLLLPVGYALARRG